MSTITIIDQIVRQQEEIERLQAENERLRATQCTTEDRAVVAINESLRTENARLKASLVIIADKISSLKAIVKGGRD